MWLYDVYICGTAAEHENAVALDNGIRGYKIPRKTEIPDPASGYSRVHVDVDEAPLLDEGRALLDGCRYFVVLCSPESRASEAVQSRLDYFEEKRGKENVIAVLCSGEPVDAFPPSFIEEKIVKHMLPDGSVEERTETIEPVASDLRGQTGRDVKRLLRYETVRIVATIMGIVPDALEQRHNRRLRRRVTAIAVVLGSVLTVSGAVFAYFGIQAAREGMIASLQAEQSQRTARRLIEDLPQMFANDPEALSYINEGILDTIVKHDGDEGALQNLFNAEGAFIVLPEDGLKAALQKAALCRALNVGDAAQAYLAASERLGPECDKELFLRMTGAFTNKPADGAPRYVFYATRDSGGLKQGDLIVAARAQSFLYLDGWTFTTGAGDAGLAGALAETLSGEECFLRVLRYSDGGLATVDISVTAAELSACGAVGV
jgi:hypothetical protein